MFRLWGKIIKNNRIITDYLFVLEATGLSQEERVSKAMEDLCYRFDIQIPIWFDENHKELALIGKTRFNDHNFIETIDFNFFEIEIVEDKK